MRKTHSVGFTLIELIIVISIIVIIAGASIHPLIKFYDLWRFSTTHMELLWDTRAAIRDMSKNIRMVRDDTSVLTATQTRFRFTDTNGTAVDYQLLGGNLNKDNAIFINNVSSFSFAYYDSTGAALPAPITSPSATDISYVVINMTVTNRGEDFSSITRIKCWNLN